MTVTFSSACQYSLDNETWVDLAANTKTPTVSPGSKIYFRASGLAPNGYSGIGTFAPSVACSVGGNILSMKNGADYKDAATSFNNYQFASLFRSAKVTDASRLYLPPSVGAYMYGTTFKGSSLIVGPKMPALTLASSCYIQMYEDCKSLQLVAPLPAPQLVSYCYQSMYSGCNKLSVIRANFLTTPSTSYTSSWVKNVASQGVFYKNPEATWDLSGTSGVPAGWVVKTM